MTKWRVALEEWVSNSPERRAIMDDHFDLTWKDVEEILKDLSTIPLDWSEPLIIAGQRSSHSVLAIWWTLISEGVGLVVERQQLATMLPRVVGAVSAHNLMVHEADLKGFEDLFQAIGYDLGQMTVLDAFQPDPILGKPVILPFKKLEQVQRCPSECGWMLMTSGSTMAPKLVMIDRQDLIARSAGEVRDFELKKEDIILNVLPTSHDVGFNQVLSWILSGAQLVIQGYSSAEKFKSKLSTNGITGVSGTPMMWAAFLKKTTANEQFPKLRYFTVSGGVLSLSEIKRLCYAFPNATLIRTYGQTETFRSLMAKDGPGSEPKETHGYPLPDVRLKIYDEFRAETADGCEGELAHEGVGAMLGYFPNPLKWREIRTGDYFRRTEAGDYRFVGRRDDLIKRWEVRMHLSELEEALRAYPDTLQACALSRPANDARQNELAAFVVMKEDAYMNRSLSEAAVMEYCKQVLPPSKVPDKIFLERSFPETASRKLDRQALRKKWESPDG